MMSSVPYVPPDTMKKVAATSGHSVSFAFLFVEVTARAGNWAGRDKVLNFLSRPPSAILALSQQKCLERVCIMQNTDIQLRCKKNVQRLKDFFVAMLGASSVRCLTLQPAAQRPLTSGGSVALRVRISDRRSVCRNRVILLGRGFS